MAGRDRSGTVSVRSESYAGFRLLSAATGLGLAGLGAFLLAIFFSNTMMPHGMQVPFGPVETDYWGYYMMGFAGALLFVWAALLLAAARAPLAMRGAGAITAFGLALNAFFRAVAWFSGEYAEVGHVPRIEAAVMLVLAIAFLWLRPPAADGRVGAR